MIHFAHEDHFDLAWRVFISDEHYTVKEYALRTACYFATTKQLFQIAEYVAENITSERLDLLYSAQILREIRKRFKEGKLKSEE